MQCQPHAPPDSRDAIPAKGPWRPVRGDLDLTAPQNPGKDPAYRRLPCYPVLLNRLTFQVSSVAPWGQRR